jgi:hypothetical protein
METRTLIQAQANVLRVTALKKGDVVKLIEKEYSSNEIYYAVVIDMLNTGKETFLQLLQYKTQYGDISASIKTYDGTKDIALFPATIEEVQEHFESAIKSMKTKIEDKKKELQKEQDALVKLEGFVDGELSKKLTTASFEEITQETYNKRVEELKQL